MIATISIYDIKDSRLAPYVSLNESQLFHYNEPGPGLFIAESAKVILRALTAGYVPESFLVEEEILTKPHVSPNFDAAVPVDFSSVPILSDADMEIRRLLTFYPDVPVFTMPREMLRHIPGYAVTRGILACFKRKPLPVSNTLSSGCKRIAVLESVDNPTNVGAIFRSAAALFMEGILLTDDCTDPLYRRAARVSMGCVFQIPYTYLFYKNTDFHYIDELHANGFKTCAMALTDDSISIADSRLKSEERLAILLGSEGHGLSAETIKKSDYVVKIPMADGVDSLNVASASTLAFWELGNVRTI